LEAGLGQLKFLSKSLFQRIIRNKRKHANQKLVFNDYIFNNRLSAFYYFKNSTARRAVYGKHYFLTSFLDAGLLSGIYNYAICQLPIRKKSEFQVVRDFILDNNLRALLLSKRNIDYLTIYGFNKPFLRTLLKGGYTFIFYCGQITPFLYFLFRKVVFTLVSKKIYVPSPIKTYFNYTDNLVDKALFGKVNFLHYNIQSTHIASALLNSMLRRFLITPLFSQHMIFSRSDWYRQPILWLLRYFLQTRYLILSLAWQEKITTATELNS